MIPWHWRLPFYNAPRVTTINNLIEIRNRDLIHNPVYRKKSIDLGYKARETYDGEVAIGINEDLIVYTLRGNVYIHELETGLKQMIKGSGISSYVQYTTNDFNIMFEDREGYIEETYNVRRGISISGPVDHMSSDGFHRFERICIDGHTYGNIDRIDEVTISTRTLNGIRFINKFIEYPTIFSSDASICFWITDDVALLLYQTKEGKTYRALMVSLQNPVIQKEIIRYIIDVNVDNGGNDGNNVFACCIPEEVGIYNEIYVFNTSPLDNQSINVIRLISKNALVREAKWLNT
jgi:hypothetical protein